MALTVWMITDLLFCEASLNLHLMFSQGQVEIMHCWPEYPSSDAVFFSVHHVRHVTSMCLVAGDIHFDHLVKVLSAVFFYYKVTTFSLCT